MVPPFRPEGCRPCALPVILIFVAQLLAASGSATGPTAAIFISEYVEGSSNNKAIELFNGSEIAVDLAAELIDIQIFLNGSPTPSSTIALSGVIPAGRTWVLTHSGADAPLLALADQTSGSLNFNGNDTVLLRAAGSDVDCVGQVGTDPGAAWGSGTTSTANNSLRRDVDVCAGDPVSNDTFDPALEWTGVGLSDVYDDLLQHSSTCSAAVFSDDFETGDDSRWSNVVPGLLPGEPDLAAD